MMDDVERDLIVALKLTRFKGETKGPLVHHPAHPAVMMSPGVAFAVNYAGASVLVDEVAAYLVGDPKRRNGRQKWSLRVRGDGAALIQGLAENGEVLAKTKLPYVPGYVRALDVRVFNGVIVLGRESV